MELKDIKGFGEKRLNTLSEVGIVTCEDLLNHYPYKYYDFQNIDAFNKDADNNLFVSCKCESEAKAVFFKGLNYVIAEYIDNTSGCKFKAVWYNQPFLKNVIKVDEEYYLYGKPNSKKQLVVQKHFLKTGSNEKILPIYKPFENIASNTIKMAIKQILDSYAEIENDNILKSAGLISKFLAYKNLHFPSTINEIEEAKFRLNLENLLLFVALEKLMLNNKCKKDHKYKFTSVSDFEVLLPFNFTENQKQALTEIYEDMDSEIKMNRLLLGDVGSGKTVVAFGAMYKCAESGYQSVLLCPTEVLAKQHYENALKLLNKFGVVFLHSAMSNAEKEIILKGIKDGSKKIIISTHSVLSEKVIFNNLSLLITDEQHRFGVEQRALLGKKNSIDQIVMSATPIPRSLSLVLFGGLEVSELKSRPNGESNIKTNILSSKKVDDMWRFVANKLNTTSNKCFVVVPKILDDETGEVASTKSIVSYLKKSGLFSEKDIVEVNGKMNKLTIEKNMEEFASKNAKVLVATTIIEVGIDVKPANIMIIFNADRFGLATLHQLRGRVGRDGSEGHCFCVTDNASEISKNRLKIFKENNDGLKIAEEDLKLRGSGTLYGTSQHGVSELFSEINFSVDEYNKAKEIWNGLDQVVKDNLTEKAREKYGELYKKVVFN